MLGMEPRSSAGALFFQDRVSLCNNRGYPGTHFVDQVGLEFTESTCLCVLSAGIKAGPTTAHLYLSFSLRLKVGTIVTSLFFFLRQ